MRVDICTYKYTFANKGVVGEHTNILAYILCSSLLDPRDMTLDELTYIATEYAGDGDAGSRTGFEKYLEMITKTWNASRAIDPLSVPGRQIG
jgi:hypothetical protein